MLATGRILQSAREFGIALSKDWTHLFNPVVDQGRCNICYASSTLGTVEAMFFMKYRRKIKLSMQEIVDCSKENAGCQGGQPSSVADYLKERGCAFQNDYKYVARGGKCRAQYKNNKFLKTYGERLLEELLSEDREEDLEYTDDGSKKEGRNLQELEFFPDYNFSDFNDHVNSSSSQSLNRDLRRNVRERRSYLSYDKFNRKFYKTVEYTDNTKKYFDMNGNSYTPGNGQSSNNSRFNGGNGTNTKKKENFPRTNLNSEAWFIGFEK